MKEQTHRPMENLEIDPQKYGQLIFNRAKAIQWREETSSTNGAVTTGCSYATKIRIQTQTLHFSQNLTQTELNLNVKCKNYKTKIKHRVKVYVTLGMMMTFYSQY